jgi:hypothetical protein
MFNGSCSVKTNLSFNIEHLTLFSWALPVNREKALDEGRPQLLRLSEWLLETIRK